ncbi:LysM domain-containing protein [uncultured Flavobacterium sp.]|uniref:LysM peptidoglycan-binding domain-containing protein n=1 Tax=uncultured Flavobacterium sp. TaxID=165435 RepID=UPI0025E3E4A0|nr:LysM domain-containing protein [uncultured Flavobacterium sp.]
MKKITALVFALLVATGVFAQADEARHRGKENKKEGTDSFFITHKVEQGEKIIMISRKYLVDPKDIYAFNKSAVNGISGGTVLLIPLHKSAKADLKTFVKELETERGSLVRVPAPPDEDGVANKSD